MSGIGRWHWRRQQQQQRERGLWGLWNGGTGKNTVEKLLRERSLEKLKAMLWLLYPSWWPFCLSFDTVGNGGLAGWNGRTMCGKISVVEQMPRMNYLQFRNLGLSEDRLPRDAGTTKVESFRQMQSWNR